MNERKEYIDFFRTIAILLIILAHVNSPKLIHELRTFDVSLFVLISGYVYKKPDNLRKYICKRIERLAFPTWIFLIAFFILEQSIEKIFNISGINLKTIISSFLFWKGIGFVWIIRIYLIVAVIAPLILKNLSFYKLLIYYLISEVLINVYILNYNNEIIIKGILYSIPYILIFLYGNLLKENKLPLKKINFILAILIVVFFIFSSEKSINFYKYPPRYIYIWYSIFISNLLFLNKDKLYLKNSYIKRFVTYVGSSTMWLYLIHIAIYWGLLFIKKTINIPWYMEYFLLFIISFILLIMKDYVLSIIDNKFKVNHKYLNIFKG